MPSKRHRHAEPNKRVLICAGGTGGHVYPAQAVAEAFKEYGYEVAWVGTGRQIEWAVVRDGKYRYFQARTPGIRGKSLRNLGNLPYRIGSEVYRGVRIIREFRPRLTIGFGGYVTGPIGIASKLTRTPLVIHEQNTIAGTANRLLSPWANHIITAFPDTFPKREKVSVLGNPIRSHLVKQSQLICPLQLRPYQSLNCLVLGGSLGAQFLNRTLPKALALMPLKDRPEIRHQTGANELNSTLFHYRQMDVEAEVKAFIEDMGSAYSWADIIICRAGALTVSEVIQFGRPALFIPLPGAIDDHQYHNAQYLSRHDLAVTIRQNEASPQRIAEVLTNWRNNTQAINRISAQLLAQANSHSAHQFVRSCTPWILS